MGRQKRGTATFKVEVDTRKGMRVSRITVCEGHTSKPKRTTYAERWCVVDGSDGRTYLLAFSGYGMIKVMQSDMQHEAGTFWLKDGELFDRYWDMLFPEKEGLSKQERAARSADADDPAVASFI